MPNPGGSRSSSMMQNKMSSRPKRRCGGRRAPKEAAPPAAAHPVLSRLLEEVRNERNVEASYDRVHNRHNRGR